MCIIKRQGLGTTSSFYNSTYFLKLKHEMLIPPSYLNKGRTFTNNLHRCKRCDLGIKAIFLIHKLNSNPGFQIIFCCGITLQSFTSIVIRQQSMLCGRVKNMHLYALFTLIHENPNISHTCILALVPFPTHHGSKYWTFCWYPKQQ